MNIFERSYRKIFNKPFTIYDASKMLIEKIRSGGGTVGDNVDILNSKIDLAHPELISIGNNVTITSCSVLTHDASTNKELHFVKYGKVVIGDNVFIGMGAIILPGTTIGSKVIVGAGTVVAKDIPDNSVVVGNPMCILSSYDEYMEKEKLRQNTHQNTL